MGGGNANISSSSSSNNNNFVPDQHEQENVEMTDADNCAGGVNVLPKDALVHIFSFCSHKEVIAGSRVCSDWFSASRENILWRWLAMYRWTFCKVPDNDWLKYFIERHRVGAKWERGRPMKDFKLATLRGHNSFITCFDMHDDYIVSGSNDHTVKVWRLDPNSTEYGYVNTHTFTGFNSALTCIQINKSNNNKKDTTTTTATTTAIVVSGAANGILLVHSLAEGRHLFTLHGHTRSISSIQIIPEINRLVSGSEDGTFKIWDLTNGSCLQTVTPAGGSHVKQLKVHVVHHPNQQQKKPSLAVTLVCATNTNNITVWDLTNVSSTAAPPCLCTIMIPATTVLPIMFEWATSTNEIVTVSSGGNTINVYDGTTGALKHTVTGSHGTITCMSMQDERRLVVGTQSGVVDVYNTTKQQYQLVHSCTGHTMRIHCVQFDETKVLSGSEDNCIFVHDMKTGAPLYTLLGGSNRIRNDSNKPGISHLQFDDCKVAAVVGNLMRVWVFL